MLTVSRILHDGDETEEDPMIQKRLGSFWFSGWLDIREADVAVIHSHRQRRSFHSITTPQNNSLPTKIFPLLLSWKNMLLDPYIADNTTCCGSYRFA